MSSTSSTASSSAAEEKSRVRKRDETEAKKEESDEPGKKRAKNENENENETEAKARADEKKEPRRATAEQLQALLKYLPKVLYSCALQDTEGKKAFTVAYERCLEQECVGKTYEDFIDWIVVCAVLGCYDGVRSEKLYNALDSMCTTGKLCAVDIPEAMKLTVHFLCGLLHGPTAGLGDRAYWSKYLAAQATAAKKEKIFDVPPSLVQLARASAPFSRRKQIDMIPFLHLYSAFAELLHDNSSVATAAWDVVLHYKQP